MMRVDASAIACAVGVGLIGLACGGRQVRERPIAGGQSRTAEDSLKNGLAPVSEASVTPLDPAGTSERVLLKVRYESGVAPGSTVRLRPDREDVILRDDGEKGDSVARDRVFSAIVQLDPRELEAERRRFTPEVLARRQIPRFEGRVRVRPTPLRPEFFDFRDRPRFPIPFFPIGLPDTTLEERSLIIRDLEVLTDPKRTFNPCTNVGNPTGVWTFGHLMTQMANQTVTGLHPSKFVREWLREWETDQVVNTFTIPKRPNIVTRIITPWLQAGGGGTALDLRRAPFRLLAIVNRVDLRQNLIYGGGSAGEARFVFGAVDLQQSCAPLPFTVIFEYGITKNSCSDLKSWAQQWYDLRTLSPSDPVYRSKLEAITQQFVKAGADPAQVPNQNALNQLRTNERAIGVPWELREFSLDSGGSPPGLLSSVTVKQEPGMSFNNTMTLAKWVNVNAADVVQDRHVVPELLPSGQHFLGARAPIPNDDVGFHWGRGVDMTTANSRFHFSLNTCSGCHTGETQTVFTHIDPVSGSPPNLSGFLTGIDVSDPDLTDTDNSVRHFDDLERRAIDLDGLVNGMCLRQIAFPPLVFMVH